MAERRMFAKSVIDSDLFLDMPQSAQLLYFHLSMRGDDDGFVNNAKSIMRNVGCKDDDMKILIAKQYILPFDSGVIVIRHWKIHNYIQKDRYHPSRCIEEKTMLALNANNEYEITIPENTDTNQVLTALDTKRIQDVSIMDTQVRLGKVRLGKVRVGKDRLGDTQEGRHDESCQTYNKPKFTKPTLEEIQLYCQERLNHVDAERFFDFYQAKGWMIGKNHMKDWKAAVRTWERASGSSGGGKRAAIDDVNSLYDELGDDEE